MKLLFARHPYLFIILIFAWLLPDPALATPPRYVQVYDIPVAVNKTHLFLFRNLSDNNGSYYTRNTTRFLISQNLETARVDAQWPLGSTFENTIDECVTDCIRTQAKGVVNPFDIFHEKNAVPVLASPLADWPADFKFPTVSGKYFLTENGLMQQQDDGPPKNLTPRNMLVQRITASLNPTMNIMPDDTTAVNPMEYDGNSYSREISQCLVQNLTANIPQYSLFSLSCEGDGGDNYIVSYRIFLSLKNKD